jgi:Family of unknown function (DUF6314)
MSRATTLQTLFRSLAGRWKLERDLHSTNTSEPSGKCYGEASFTARPPSPVLQEDGKLDLASAELLYHEQGEFELPNCIRLPFSKKYIWRLNQESSEISIWFAKPGSEAVDYLFHKIGIPGSDSGEQSGEQKQHRQLHGSGGHLCVDDFYNTSYTFTSDAGDLDIVAWESLHEVRGPKKDQLIFTKFEKAESSDH